MRSHEPQLRGRKDSDPATIQVRQQQQPLLDTNNNNNRSNSMEDEITLTGGTLLGNPSTTTTTSTSATQDPLSSSSTAGGGGDVEMTDASSTATPGTTSKSKKMTTMEALQQYQAKIHQAQQQAAAHAHSHNHSHSHNHGHKDCCGGPQAMPMPVIKLKMPPDEMVRTQSETEILQALKLITKMGQYALLQDIVQAWNEHKGKDQVDAVLRQQEQPDQEGHTLLHWAAKRTEDLRFTQFWANYISLTVATTDNTGMTPLHWACTEPKPFAVLQYMLTMPQAAKDGLLEKRDGSGCTPLLLAAQHGHVETVAFLVHQFHARLDALDDSGDSATHWAAYKGSAAVLGLLAYYEKNNTDNNNKVVMLQKPDSYGQTPLHLAALRGHSGACQYILRHIAGPNNEHRKEALALLSLPDKNGRTPHALALHKNKPHTAACLQQAERALQILNLSSSSSKSWGARNNIRTLWQVVVKDWLCNTHLWKMWMGIPTGMDDPMDVAPSFPNYYVMVQVVLNIWFQFAIYVPLFNLGKGVLWDCTFVNLLQTLLTVSCVICLYKCQTTNPGKLDESCPEIGYWRRLYGETLASYADQPPTDDNDEGSGGNGNKRLQLCHTCHIARPPRSKHDRHFGVCVLLFDHNCPFVGNTVGLYNYQWFYLFLLSMTWYFVNHIYLLIKYTARKDDVSLWTLALGVYLAVHIFMTGSLFVYHTQLIWLNLTTNEHINIRRYDYLWTTDAVSGAKKYKNPWNQGVARNFMDRFNPSHDSYMLPELQERLLSPSSSMSNSNKKGEEMV